MLSSRKESEDERRRKSLERYMNGPEGRYELERLGEGESFILQVDNLRLRVCKVKDKAVVGFLPDDPP
jgi:hypothetical protein